MDRRVFKILLSLILFYGPQAKAGTDSLPAFSKLFLYTLLDVQQQKSIHIYKDKKPLIVIVFLSPECPLCQNYTKTLNELQQAFKQQITIYGVIAGSAYSIKDINEFREKYKSDFKLLIDSRKNFTKYLRATVTPEAMLLTDKGSLIYEGAVDDWAIALGKKKIQASQHYLQDAIEQSLNNQPISIRKTTAVGCKINDY